MNNNFISKLTLLCVVVVVFISHTFIAPVLAGLVLASGLRPLLLVFPFNKIKSVKIKTLTLLLAFLSVFGTLGTYVIIASARGIARNVDLRQIKDQEEKNKEKKLKAESKSESHSDSEPHLDSLTPEVQKLVEDEEQKLENTEQKEASTIEAEAKETPEAGKATFVDRAKKIISKIPGMNTEEVSRAWSDLLRGARNVMLTFLSKILSAGPGVVVEWAVFLLAFIFFFWGYDVFVKVMRSFNARYSGMNQAVTFFENATQATLMGTLVVGSCQGAIVSIGTAIAGFDSFVLLGFCAFFASFVPFFGTALVWGSVLIYSLVDGNSDAAIIVGVTGALSSVADNLILPTFVGSKNKVHPLLLFVVVIGMMNLVGLWGLLLGPVLSIFSTRMLELWYKKEVTG